MGNVIQLKNRRKQNEDLLQQQRFLDTLAREKAEKGIDWIAIFSDPKERQRFQMRLYQEAMEGVPDDHDDSEYEYLEELLLNQKD